MATLRGIESLFWEPKTAKAVFSFGDQKANELLHLHEEPAMQGGLGSGSRHERSGGAR